MIITLWERLINGVWMHNHIEDGWNPHATEPTARCEYQRHCWKGSTWRAIEARLEGGTVTSGDVGT